MEKIVVNFVSNSPGVDRSAGDGARFVTRAQRLTARRHLGMRALQREPSQSHGISRPSRVALAGQLATSCIPDA